MVAIFTGIGLGVERGSGFVLGSRGQLGDSTYNRYGENVSVNAATGNLAIQRTDEILIGQGPDSVIGRAYNSLGTATDDNGDNWQLNAQRRLTHSGLPNTSGSTVTLIDWDGSDVLYTYDGSSYVTTQGSGAYDHITFNPSTNVWTRIDGNSQVAETYDEAHGGRLMAVTDEDANAVTYTYDPSTGHLIKATVTDSAAMTAEHTDLTWSGNNITQVVTTRTDGTTLTRVRYTYDGSNRLSTVTTDLSPDDSAVTDGNTVVTTYTYDGVSKRVASIAQTGGALLNIYYDGSFRVSSYKITTDSVGGTPLTSTTTFSYDTVHNATTITDQLGNATKLTYDASGQLTRIDSPPAVSGAAAQVQTFTYDGSGNVLSVTDAAGNTTTNTYDITNGNQLSQRDAAGNTVTRTFDGHNNLLTETRYVVPDPDGAGSGAPSTPLTTRYAYDSGDHLRYAISATGEVTVYYPYSAGSPYGAGNTKASIVLRDKFIDLSALAPTDPLTQTAMDSWLALQTDRSNSEETWIYYDFRGNVSSVTTYSANATNGNGLTTSPYKVVSYIYDQFGNLRQRQTTGETNIEYFVEDGLGRTTSVIDLTAGATTTVFTDSLNKAAVTLATGLVETTTYDLAGEMISYAKSNVETGAATQTTSYTYDTVGNLRMVTDATNNTTYYLYDAVGRKTADIAADGSITEYRYDAGDRLVATIDYATRLTSLSSLVSGGRPANVALSTIRPTAAAGDVWTFRIYDTANRLVESIDGDGTATIFAYDGLSNLVATYAFGNVISSGTIAGYISTALPTTLQWPAADSVRDSVTRNFYDNDGRLTGSLDGLGYLTRIIYNGAGEKIETVAYVTAAASGLRATGTFSALLTSVGTNAADQHTRYFYDNRGLLIYMLDANLHVVEYGYDNADHLLHTFDYGTSIASTTTYTAAYVASQITSLGLGTAATTRKSWNVYDPATGQLYYAIDAQGAVTHFSYDLLNQVKRTLQYTTAMTVTSDPSVTDVSTWLGTQPYSTDWRVNDWTYNNAGQLRYTSTRINNAPQSYVTEYRYDAAGRKTLEIRYADPYLAGTTVDAMTTLIGATPSTAIQSSFVYDVDGRVVDSYDGESVRTHTVYDPQGRVTSRAVAYGTATVATTNYAYDAAGRLSDSYDPTGMRTHFVYDGFGRLTDQTVAYGTASAMTTHYVYDQLGQVASRTDAYLQTETTTTSFTYDGFGNVLSSTDGRGHASHFTYDNVDNMLSSTDAAGATTYYQYNTFRQVILTTGPLGDLTYDFYDTLGRRALTIDGERYATRSSYSVHGDLLSVVHYATKVTGTITAGVPPTVTTNAADETTVLSYDWLHEVVQQTDAAGGVESYTYDAFGDRLTTTGKLGGVITSTYDRRGLLLSQTMVYTRADDPTHPMTVVDKFSYDNRGNRIQMIEAYGRPEQRTTDYTYDLDDRLLTTKSDDLITVVSASDFHTTSTVHPTTTLVYDVLGNVIESDDANGARTFCYYDRLGRKIEEVSPVGTLSTFTYDSNGNMASQRVYDTAITPPTTPGGTPPSPAGGSGWRETVYAYDNDNRVLTTTVAGLRTGAYGGSAYSTQAVGSTVSVAISNTYDAGGNLVHQVDGNSGNSWFFYDKRGLKVAQVDQENYLTAYTLDADGNVANETRYATRLTVTVGAASVPATLAATVSGNADDRITNFTYDKMGRRLTEARSGVAISTVNATTGALTTATGTATVSYTYNALGEVTRKTEAEATTDHTDYAYDTLGRQTSVTGAGFTDYTGAAVNTVTLQYYDGLNDVTSSVVNGSRTTGESYGAGGRLATMTDASGFVHTYQYDANGKVLVDSYTRLTSAGASLTEATLYTYDAAGRLTRQVKATLSGTSWVLGDTTDIAYNTFGEVAGKGANGMAQESFAYDKAGRVVRSTAGDGTVRFYVYDADGNQTLMISSSGDALPSGYSWASITLDQAITLLTSSGTAAIGTVPVAGMLVTITAYDKRGQAVQTIEPMRQIAGDATAGYTTATITHAKSYNAFGEVASETDARGDVTTYAYNTLGKVVLRTLPAVSYVLVNGSTSTGAVSPLETSYYDASGRVVATMDANGNVSTRLLLAGSGMNGADPLTIKEFHPDTGSFVSAYDAFGDLRKTTNALGAVETFTYDAMDRLLTDTHPTRAIASVGNTSGVAITMVDTYAYDGLGERLSHTNSLYGSGTKDTADYDLEGRVVKSVDMGGNTTTTSYAWYATVTATGLGTFGGWIRTIVNPAGKTEAVTTDYFGRLTNKHDFGGNVDILSFDLAGRTIGSGNYTGAAITSYFNTGLVAGTATTTTQLEGTIYYTYTVSATYAYDVDGERTYEGYTRTRAWTTFDIHSGDPIDHLTTKVLEDATATWDADGRQLTLTDTGYRSFAAVSIAYSYDLAGNVKHLYATFPVIDAQGGVTASTTPEDYWYNYDSMNRFTTTMGTLSGGVISHGSTGSDITYNADGSRATMTDATGTEAYSYTADGYLAKVTVGGVQRALYEIDAMGRATSYTEYDSGGSTAVYSRAATYDVKSQVTTDTVSVTRGSDHYITTTNYGYNDVTTGVYDGGVVTDAAMTVNTKNGTSLGLTDTKNKYQWFDAAAQSEIDFTPVSGGTQVSTYKYDGAAHLYSVVIADGRPRTVSFMTDVYGQVLKRDEADGNLTNGDPHEMRYYFNGMQVGDVSNNGTSDTDYVASIAAHTAASAGSGAFRNGANFTTGAALTYANFDQSYSPINGNSVQSTASRYTVSDGDSLQSIAQSVWGDASMWYLIADANGLSASDTLPAGISLVIPNKVTNIHNNNSTFKVYDPNEAIGDTAPTVPKPANGNNCGVFGQIILVVIAIAVSAFTYGALLGPMTAALGLGETVGAVAAGVVAGAAGSIASQTVGVITGIQKSFNWGAVGIAAITAGVTKGLGASGLFDALGIAGDGFPAQFAQGALSSAASQGIAVATGLQKKFDWTAVATAGIGAGVGSAVGGWLGVDTATTQFQHDLLAGVAGMAGGIVNAAARTLVNGTDFGDNLIAALPDTIGQTIGGFVAGAMLGDYDAPAPSSPPADVVGMADDDGATGSGYGGGRYIRAGVGGPEADYVADAPDVAEAAKGYGGFWGWVKHEVGAVRRDLGLDNPGSVASIVADAIPAPMLGVFGIESVIVDAERVGKWLDRPLGFGSVPRVVDHLTLSQYAPLLAPTEALVRLILQPEMRQLRPMTGNDVANAAAVIPAVRGISVAERAVVIVADAARTLSVADRALIATSEVAHGATLVQSSPGVAQLGNAPVGASSAAAQLTSRLGRLGYDSANTDRIMQAVQNGDKIVVVGENMQRVGAIANMVNDAGGTAVTYTPRNVVGPSRNALEANRSWLSYWVKDKGATVIDIGRQPTPRPTGPSAFYGVENRSLHNWDIYTPF